MLYRESAHWTHPLTSLGSGCSSAKWGSGWWLLDVFPALALRTAYTGQILGALVLGGGRTIFFMREQMRGRGCGCQGGEPLRLLLHKQEKCRQLRTHPESPVTRLPGWTLTTAGIAPGCRSDHLSEAGKTSILFSMLCKGSFTTLGTRPHLCQFSKRQEIPSPTLHLQTHKVFGLATSGTDLGNSRVAESGRASGFL